MRKVVLALLCLTITYFAASCQVSGNPSSQQKKWMLVAGAAQGTSTPLGGNKYRFTFPEADISAFTVEPQHEMKDFTMENFNDFWNSQQGKLQSAVIAIAVQDQRKHAKHYFEMNNISYNPDTKELNFEGTLVKGSTPPPQGKTKIERSMLVVGMIGPGGIS